MELLDYRTIDLNNIVFDDIREIKFPFQHKKITISIKNSEGELVPLLLAIGTLPSPGVKKTLYGGPECYSLPLNLFSVACGTKDEQKFVKVLTDIINKCKEHLITIGYDEGRLKKFGNCLYHRMIYLDPDLPGLPSPKGPILYLKVKLDKSSQSPGIFLDEKEVSYEDFKKYTNFSIQSAIRMDSIFIGDNECLFRRN